MRRRIHPEEATGELNIVPYLDVVVNLVIFMLLSMTGLISLGVLNVSAPRISTEAAAPGESGPKLLLTVAIGRQGFYVAGAGGVLGSEASATDMERPPTIPLKGDRYDYEALTSELVKIKEQYPNETQVILSADPGILYDTLIQTMDACRDELVKLPDGTIEHKPLFFDVSLSLIG